MVGICGVVGDQTAAVDALVEGLTWTGGEATETTARAGVAVGVATHPSDPPSGPAVVPERDATVWLWGDVWGYEGAGGYERIETPPAAFAANRYAERGIDFVEGLNGSFAGVIHDREAGRVQVFTDRLGTRPVHHARTDDGAVFSTDIQSLPAHPAVPRGFDVDALAEYFTLQRSFGLETPLEGIELLPPGSVTTFDLDGGSVETTRYWEPRYEPEDRPRSYFADRLATLVERVVEERTDPDATYGLLLSGGSDSRLALAALTAADRTVRAYHLNEWENEEADVARRAAASVGADYTFLRRDQDYHARVLEETAPITNFVGYFNQVHAAGFADRLDEEVDELVTGHYGDMLFEGNHFPTREVDLGGLGSFDLPVERDVRTTGDLVEHRVGGRTAPAYIADALDGDIAEIYAANVAHRGDRVVDHGVEYRSLREAVVASRCPLTNGTSQIFYHGTLQMLPSWTPFLDNRLVDLFLSTPARHLLRGGLVGAAVKRLAPDLAAIPHANSGVGLSRPFAAQWLGRIATGFAERYLADPPAESHWTSGPWPDHGDLIRTNDFVRETLEEHEDLIRALPFLDVDGVAACYQDHLDGAHNLAALYSLVTFLEMPVVQELARESAAPLTARPGSAESD